MKTIDKLFLGIGLCVGLAACSDFDDVNTDPKAVGAEFVKPHYALNNSIGQAQMNPGTAERVVVYHWGSAARICGEMSFMNVGRYNDEYTSAYYYPDLSGSIKNATLAISAADAQLTVSGTSEQEKEFYPNVKQFARIWRAYLISEFLDNFGPYPIESFLGENPVFNTQKDGYLFLLKELKEAAAGINTAVKASEDQGKCDPFEGIKYDPVKWQKYANSLRMRLAMRLSKVEPATAQREFEDAVKGAKITDASDLFTVKENNGWDNFTGIFTRSYNDQVLSSTVSNLLTNLGGVTVEEQRPDLAAYVKPSDYLGIKYDRHYVGNTDNPTKQYWLDGLPTNLDPRALKIFCLPDDSKADNYIDKYTKDIETAKNFSLLTVDEDGKPIPDKDKPGKIKIDATCCWNGYPAGSLSSWSPKLAYNELITGGAGPGCTLPMLSKEYCEGKSRIFFAAWETYFLMAEAALYGWNVGGTTAKVAYEDGVKASFAYFGVSSYVDSYLTSTDYNRVGTSVKFDHIIEPSSVIMNYKEGYNGNAEKTVTYEYPTASKTLYGKALNDQLTKVITQKFIAQTPYLVLEMWSDFRRLGLPFFEVPANDESMTGSDMVNVLSSTSWKSGQKWDFYPQRMRYPTALDNADPEGYQKAVELLGGKDVTITPLWWAKH